METELKLTKARAALVAQFPFWGALALRLKFEPCEDIKTADVDGKTMRYSPGFVAGLTMPELIGVVAHEVGHCALGHVWRRGARDGKGWNIAADMALNPLLDAAGLTLPKGALRDPAMVGKSAEEIYAAMPRDGGGKSRQDGNGQDPGGCGGMRDPAEPAPGKSPPSPADLAQAESEWKIATVQAANAARAAGKLGGDLSRAVDGVKRPQVDWRDKLRRFVSSTVPSDYRWNPPNRRYAWQGIILPSLRPDRIGSVVVAVDTSGSISAAVLAMFQAELNAIVDDCRPDVVHVVYCDSVVQHTAEYGASDGPIVLTAPGGGGTDFRPVLDWCDREALTPACLVYLTDLYGPAHTSPPDYPVLWVSTGADRAPWGDVAMLDPAA